jgi:hypothetical protein
MSVLSHCLKSSFDGRINQEVKQTVTFKAILFDLSSFPGPSSLHRGGYSCKRHTKEDTAHVDTHFFSFSHSPGLTNFPKKDNLVLIHKIILGTIIISAKHLHIKECLVELCCMFELHKVKLSSGKSF